MAKKNPTLYSIPKTFFWFAIVSLVLLFGLVGIVYCDYAREWKVWQKKFIQLKAQKVKEEMAGAEQRIDKQKLDELKKKDAEARASFEAQKAGYQKLQKEVSSLDPKITKAKSGFQDLKQFQDSYKYYLEEYLLHKDRRASGYERRLKELEPKLARAKEELEALEKRKEEADSKLRGLTAAQKKFQREIDKALEEKNRLEKRLESIEPKSSLMRFARNALNAPMVDFVAPSLRIQQIVLDQLTDDYHFAKAQKVDRCTTCHLGIDQKGFEDAPQPFRTHPNLELYLSSASPHAMEKVGCTVCHGGNGHSVSFKDSAHTPRNEAQAEEWRKKHRWADLEKWDAKMLPMNHIEASCTKCHHGVVEVPRAEKLNQGRRLAAEAGCLGCHKIKDFSMAGGQSAWKVGPSLLSVGSKVNEDWIVRWLEDPRSFRPSTRMPRIFHLSNTSSPEDKAKNDVAIRSIAAYLMKNSEPVSLSRPAVEGEPPRGEKLLKEVGCLGCHSITGQKVGDVGPELSGLGSKVTAEWLYTWLKDPKHFSPNTRMPNLRLSDEEASDITSYLLSEKNADFDAKPLAPADPKVADELILTLLQSAMRRTEAEAELSRMTADERLQYLGKKSIAHQGCFACHAIKGFSAGGGPASGGEDAKPIGTELSDEGRKNLHQFDFGFAHLDHSRQAWIAQKLKDPRIFDQGKIKAYYDKLRMPQFNFTDEEIGALTTFVLSLNEESIPLEMQRRLEAKDIQTEKGRVLVSKLNCNACHQLDGRKGALREFVEDKGTAPPILDGEGAKTQENWLHEFLKAPSTIRPWLTYRMPTFGLNEEELKDLVFYFDSLAGQQPSYKGLEPPPTSPGKLQAGKALFDQLQCVKCHQVNAQTLAMGASFLAPDLTLTKKRLKPDWVHKWITDPQVLEPGTMMPTFFPEGSTPLPDVLGGSADEQAQAIRDHLYRYETQPSAEKA